MTTVLDAALPPSSGMTLRDYFAAHAMAAYITEGYVGARARGQDVEWSLADVAAFAFDQADAMIEERALYDEGCAK